jgi:uncharacterized protein YndB with AHSA1/START domain
MTILFIILSIIGSLIVIVLLAALVTKKEYAVHQQVTVDLPPQQVFDYVKFIKNQEQYSKWVMADPNMKKKYIGNDGTVGFIYAWDGNDKAGKGEQEIKNIEEGRSLQTELRFEKPFEGTAYVTMSTIQTSPDHTTISWEMRGKNKFPMNAMYPIIRGKLEKDMAESLSKLKVVLKNS